VPAIDYPPSQPKPPRRTSRRGRIGLIACGILFCLLSAWQGMLAARPFLLAAHLRDANDDLERQILIYRLQNQRARKEIKTLETQQGFEREARKLGWQRPNERRLRIPE